MSLYRNDEISYVKYAIESILIQTFSAFDFFIITDGPVAETVDSYLSSLQDSRIIVRHRKENKGLAESMNDLLKEARAVGYDFLARMDADDISLSNRFEKQVSFLENHPEIDIIGGAVSEIDERGIDRRKIVRFPVAPDECREFFAKRNPVAHPAVMFRRSFFEKAGWAYPTDFVRNEDTRLWHEGYKHGCVFANIPDVVLNFRVTDNMFKQRRNGKEFAKSQLKLRKLIKKDLGYGFMADVYAYAMYVLMISPSWILKIAYKVLR